MPMDHIRIAPCKGIQDSLRFWILTMDSGFEEPRFRLLCLWNLYSGFKWSVGLRIPLAVFRIP